MLNQETQDLIINAAIAAPSADNSQPFKFSWLANTTLSLWIDKSRAGKASDNRFVLSDIALGAVIENIAIQAKSLMLQSHIDYFPNGESDELYVAKIVFTTLNENQEDPDNLAKEIFNRCTDRRFPFKGPITQNNKAQLTAAAQSHDCNTIWFEDKKSIKRALPVIQQAETIRFKSEILHQELFSTVKFDQEDSSEGMHISVLAIEKPAQPFFKLMKKWSFMKIINKLGGASMLGLRSVKIPIMFSPALLLITMNDNSRLSVIKAGRAIQRVWLQATQCGLAVQPYAAPGIFSLGFINCEQEFEEDLAHVNLQMQDLMHINKSPNHCGLMFFRIGKNKPIKVRTHRRKATSFKR